ncbi:MAG TPA: response regulator, partial [Planctomycetota bacterium]|nr:response regulator [Planctomycetota bacterium]
MTGSSAPSRRWRVLVADDSAVARRLLVEALASEPALEVVGCAAHGQEALELFDRLAPDAVTLDVEMPMLDGVAVLREIRGRSPCVPVV